MSGQWDESKEFGGDSLPQPQEGPSAPFSGDDWAAGAHKGERTRRALVVANKAIAAVLVLVVAVGAGAMVVKKNMDPRTERVYIRESPETTSSKETEAVVSPAARWQCLDSQGTLRYSTGEVVYGDERCISQPDPLPPVAESATSSSEEEAPEVPGEDDGGVSAPEPTPSEPVVPSTPPGPVEPPQAPLSPSPGEDGAG